MSKPKVYIDKRGAFSRNVESMFRNHGWDVTYVVDQADLVQMTGGVDVDPRLYDEELHPLTHISEKRDSSDIILITEAINKGIPLAGICRGAQLLNVMSGGTMWQHVDGHTDPHNIVDLFTGETYMATSTHHQMMIPHFNGTVIAVAEPVRSTFRERMVKNQIVREVTTKVDLDCEVVYYEHTNALCFQPHPEYGAIARECEEYYFKLIDEYLELY